MNIKFVTWNMAHWSHRNLNEDSWKYFSQDIGADILLFQEAYPNYSIIKEDSTVWNEIGGSRPWGSGIYSEKFKIGEFPFKNSFIGSVVASEVEIKPYFNLIVISVYAMLETLFGQAWSIPNLHRIFSDLTEIVANPSYKHRVVIAGDLNASLQFDETSGNDSHRVFFNRLKEFGLHNCFEGYFDDYVQTLRHSRSAKPWQNDYFFISNKLKKSLVNCEVLDNEKVREFSDHNPVFIELDI
jgi:hypothetical protein